MWSTNLPGGDGQQFTIDNNTNDVHGSIKRQKTNIEERENNNARWLYT